jgi:peptidoglycan hydrolase CwlO-like protein
MACEECEGLLDEITDLSTAVEDAEKDRDEARDDRDALEKQLEELKGDIMDLIR